MKDVLAYPDKRWNWDQLSRNPSITISDVKAHPNNPWNWDPLSGNLGITIKDVEAHLDKHLELGRIIYEPRNNNGRHVGTSE